ncbi:hypothetical protein GTHT12_03254 [Geobacillus thermodenitrificans]|nr:hypothetical protein GTHT12_03254 [Geobacillus thermodenitrificans]KQB94811.1 hypothetical protein GEPA3_0164 [Geobacillus sp. PA-3]
MDQVKYRRETSLDPFTICLIKIEQFSLRNELYQIGVEQEMIQPLEHLLNSSFICFTIKQNGNERGECLL